MPKSWLHGSLKTWLLVLVIFCFSSGAGIAILIKTSRPRLPGPYTIFKTEPSFIPSNVKILHRAEDANLLEPGYIFIAPHIVTYGFGPQIIDHDGNLVWHGFPTVSRFNGNPVYAAPVFVCDFMGQKMNHICYSETYPSGYESQDIHEGGAHRIFDNTYRQIGQEFGLLGNLETTPNAHEFNMLQGGNSFIQAVSPVRRQDLSAIYGPRDGWIEDGCFQEIDVHSRRVMFQWCFSDHYRPSWETYFFLDIPENTMNVSGSSKGSRASPWDFMHINAIDKNAEGDYLVSGRHISQILKIAGPHSSSGLPPGTTIWRLNGRNSDFTFASEEAKFARPHHCRFLSTGQNETLISLFNNAFNGSYTQANSSNALILRLNNVTMQASLENIYPHPKGRISYAQGSALVLPGSRRNVFVGWGAWPEWSEFASNGTLLYHATTFADKSQYVKRLTNYRAFKFPWLGRPNYPPKLVSYTRKCPSKESPAPLMAYVSWNGATEVGFWRFYTSRTRTSLRSLVGTFAKNGFETKVQLQSTFLPSQSGRWVTVEAIDNKDNKSIIGTTTSRIFIPPIRWQPSCGSDACFHGSRFEYNAAADGLRCTELPLLNAIVELIFIITVIESAVWLFSMVSLKSNSATPQYHRFLP